MCILLSAAAPAVLTACAPRETPDLRWVGPVTPVANAATCPPSRGVLLLRNGAVTFTPNEGTWVLTGQATPDGNMQADRTRSSGSGQNAKTFETRLDAKWSESEVNGTYTTPRCSYRVALQRK